MASSELTEQITTDIQEPTDVNSDVSDDFIITQAPSPLNLTETPRSQFAAVIFHDIPETYTADIDIHCHYTLTPDISPTSRDWIGLYRVGWMSYRDYIYYEWAPLPPDDESKITIVFPKSKLPTDNGEFYQYCYVTRSGQIRGASTPFQFRKPRAEDFVEIEDEDDDLLVIRPSKVVLEEKLQDSENEHKKLQQVHDLVVTERDLHVVTIVRLNKDIQQEKKAKKNVKMKLLRSDEALKEKSRELMQLRCDKSELESVMQSLVESREVLEKKMEGNQKEVDQMTARVKSLCNERDELNGKIQSLVEEKELYKNTLTSLELTSAGHITKIESLNKHLKASESQRRELEGRIHEMTKNLSDEEKKVTDQKTVSEENQMKLIEVVELLSDAENKLQVCEGRKLLLNEEIEAYNETQQKMSRDLENSEMVVFNLRVKIRELHEEIEMMTGMIQATKAENKDLAGQVTALLSQLDSIPELTDKIAALQLANDDQQTTMLELGVADEKVKQLEGTIEELKGSIESSTGSLYALQKANDSLKSRLTKYKTAYFDSRKQREQLLSVQKLHIERENELKRENEDFKERMTMCTNEYKALYVKHMKMERKIAKKIRNDSKQDAEQTTDTDEGGETFYDGCETADDVGPPKIVDDQISRLKKERFDMQADFDIKARYMENLLTQKDVEMAELRRVVATMKSESPRSTPAEPSPSVYPVMVCPYPDRNVLKYPYPLQNSYQENIVSVKVIKGHINRNTSNRN